MVSNLCKSGEYYSMKWIFNVLILSFGGFFCLDWCYLSDVLGKWSLLSVCFVIIVFIYNGLIV